MTLDDKLNEFLNNNDAHAILIDGPWGVGKTFAINEWTQKIKKERLKVIYLSLFGLSDINQLNALALESEGFRNTFVKYLKSLNQDVTVGVNGISLSIPLIGMVANLLKQTHKSKNVYLFVIDDIDRKDLNLKPREIYGFVDSLPKQNTKVILVMNKEKSDEKDEFDGLKDKVVQKEYYFEYPTDEAIKNILGDNFNLFDEDSKKYIQNLRTLKKVNSILNNIKGSCDSSLAKCILLCCTNIWENRFNKKEYFEYLKETKIQFAKYDPNSKRNLETELKEEIKDLKDSKLSNFTYFSRLVSSKNLLPDLKQHRINDFLYSVYRCIQKEDYITLKSIKSPLKSNASILFNFEETLLFLSGNPSKDCINLMLKFQDLFNKQETNLYEVYNTLLRTICNADSATLLSSKAQSSIKSTLNMCVKPVANYIAVALNNYEDAHLIVIQSMFEQKTKQMIEIDKRIFKESVKILNSSILRTIKEGSFKLDYLEEKKRIYSDLFGTICRTNQNIYNYDKILTQYAKHLFSKSSSKIDFIDWSELHKFFNYASKISKDNDLPELKNLINSFLKHDSIISKRISFLNNQYKISI